MFSNRSKASEIQWQKISRWLFERNGEVLCVLSSDNVVYTTLSVTLHHETKHKYISLKREEEKRQNTSHALTAINLTTSSHHKVCCKMFECSSCKFQGQ
jgi:hypothetical protein